MTLRKKTWIAILAGGTAAAIAFYITSSTIVLRGFAVLEEQVVRDGVRQVCEHLEDVLGQLDTMTRDWAIWDDTYWFVEDGNERYIQSVMSDESLANLRINFLIVAQTTGRIIFGTAFDPIAKKKAPLTQSIQAHLSTNSLLMRQCVAGLDVKGLLRLPEGLMQIAARPILTSAAKGPSRGALIMGRYISPSEIQQLSKLTRFHVTIQALNGADLPLDFKESRIELLVDEGAIPVRVLGQDRVAGYAALKDIYRRPVALLRVDMPRSVHAQALATMKIHAATLLILSLIFGVVFLRLIEKVILSRLTQLSRQVRQFGASGLTGIRLPLTGRDELTDLISELNHMLDALEQYDADRKHMEASLRESEERFRQVAESAGEWIWEINIEGVYTYSSPVVESLLGYQPEEIVGKKRFYDLFVPESREAQKTRALKILSRGESFHKFTNENVHKEGQVVIVESSGIPMRDGKGNLIGYRGTDVNITERKKAEEEIRRLNVELERRVLQLVTVNKELEAFSYSVSHDLRGPLRTIDGFSQILLEDYGDKLEEAGRRDLDRVHKAVWKMSQLIDAMLMLSRLTRQELKMGRVNLSRLAMEILTELRKTNPARQVELIVAPGIEVEGDEGLLQIVLQNLLNNAWKYTRNCEQSRIEFGVGEKNGKQVFHVRDNGVGFDMRYVDKLFGEFQRLHTEDEFEGTGIGLATIQRIIHRHGGKVWAEGEVGKGATFYFKI